MNEPKLHHYVPRFYLKHFLDPKQQLWVYDKAVDRVFRTTPNRIAAETQFYRLPELMGGAFDALSIEKALSDLEFRASKVIARVVAEVSTLSGAKKVTVSDEERLILSEYLAAQHFRTLELRDLMLYLLEDAGLVEDSLSVEDQKAIHFQILSDSGLLEEFEESIYRAIWIFAKNESEIPLVTSDHPVCMKSSNNRMWIKGVGPLRDGSYLVFPITPKLILYCKEPSFWSKVKRHDLCVSPIKLDHDMVHHENCGQAFMASRFLISCSNDFQEVQDFIPSIGTDVYASEDDADGTGAVERTASFNSKRRGKLK
jgi:Protein of unknown function (DUF4238)